jgi:predicted N-acyltransferase
VTFDVRLAHRVEEIGQEAWDRLGPDRPFASYRWYRFGEAALGDGTAIYLVLSSAGEPVARATFWLTTRETLPIPSRALRFGLGIVLRRWPLLACRSPLSGTSGLILPEPPLRDPALATIVQCAEELARQHHASFLLFDYIDRDQVDWTGWPANLVRVPGMSPGTQLVIRWSDFESYLAHLSKKRRYNIRRNYRLVAQEGVEIRRHRTVMDVDGAMALHRKVTERHGSSDEPWMRGAMGNASMVDAAWLAADKGGRLVGCELVLGDRGGWFVTGLGLDDDAQNVYFVLGYEDIRYAIEHRAHTLRWGTGAYDVKRRLGFEPEANSNLAFSARWPLLQKLGRWIALQLSVVG